MTDAKSADERDEPKRESYVDGWYGTECFLRDWTDWFQLVPHE